MTESSIQHRPAKTWKKIIIEVDSRMTDAVAAYLTDLSGSGVEISPSENRSTAKKSGVTFDKIISYLLIGPGESAKRSVAEKTNELELFLDNLSHIFTECSSPSLNTEIIEEEDWGKAWKSFFTSFQITPKLIIKPSWEEAKEQSQDDNGKYIIEMDPGLAFGTGHHASTQLALLLLEELLKNNKGELIKILDVGTGSGILAMGCAHFGAKHILAIDNDPDAIETAKANIIRNRLEHIVTVSGQDIASIQPGFDLLVANITHDTLADMAKPLTGLLAPKGYLVLSGILKGEQGDSIREIYTKHGFNYMKDLAKDEWIGLQFQKNDK
jgi:ribosomal protein L11 methyltransferase